MFFVRRSFPCAIVLLFFLVLAGCDEKENSSQQVSELTQSYLGPDTVAFYQRSEKMRNHIKSKKLPFLSDLLGEPLTTDSVLIYHFTGNDCGSCVYKGINAIKKFGNGSSLPIIPIAYNSDIGNIQMHFDFEKTVHSDEANSMRKSLGYFQTPVMILYSASNGILDSYILPTFDDHGRLDRFMTKIINSLDQNGGAN